MAQKPHAWHPADIYALVKKRGSTLTDIARKSDLSPSTPIAAMRRPCYAGEQAIAKFVSIEAHILWPDRYDDAGYPLHKRVRKNIFNVINRMKSSKKDVAA